MGVGVWVLTAPEVLFDYIIALMQYTTPILAILIYPYKKIAHLMPIFLVKTSHF